MTGHELTVRHWESSCGREGIWCRHCRRSTPVAHLVLEPGGRAILPCETCGAPLRRGRSS